MSKPRPSRPPVRSSERDARKPARGQRSIGGADSAKNGEKQQPPEASAPTTREQRVEKLQNDSLLQAHSERMWQYGAMHWLDPDDLDAQSVQWDETVLRTPDIDQFCSSSAWVLPAHNGLMPAREPWIVSNSAGWVAFARGHDAFYGSYLEPLEAMWGMASPFVGADPERLVSLAYDALQADPSWRLVILSGLSPTGVFIREVVSRKQHGWSVLPAASMARRRASLEGGYAGYLSRRSSGFRRNLAKAQRRAESRGVAVEMLNGMSDGTALDSTFERIIDVERRSWKGRAGNGIESGRMREFYRLMVPRLASRGALRVLFATCDGEDLAYHFGGVFANTYRGLQHSYDARYRSLSLGALCHAQMIRSVCDEGLSLYDLGQETPYKARWAESVYETITLVLLRAG